MNEIDKPADGSFLSRWSRRKSGAAAPEENAPPNGPMAAALPKSSTGAASGAEMPETPHPEPTSPAGQEVRQELPPIDSLTHEADFSPFMARDVDAGLRNQALKKLFTDPHYQFGQMDKLDIYIDDYSQPDPIPIEMLRKMNQAKSLFLFDDDDKDAPQTPDKPIGGDGGTAPPVTADVRAVGANGPVAADTGSASHGTGNAPEKVVGLVSEKPAGAHE